MSAIKLIMELDPPTMASIHEDMVGAPCECPICHGMGWHWIKNPVSTESEKKVCEQCDGRGYVIPYIHINWGAPLRN
jgi:hypothetical protein